LQDGKIEAEVKLTGILSLGALMPGESRKYGTTIAPGLYAPVHQHFFVARIDMAVDCKPNEAHNQVGVAIYLHLFFISIKLPTKNSLQSEWDHTKFNYIFTSDQIKEIEMTVPANVT